MKEQIEHLIYNCRKGDRNAQLSIYKQYAQKLYATSLRITGNVYEAEEAMQDTFLKIFTRLEQYDVKQSFEAWIQRIAIHTAIDYVRKQQHLWEELSENYAEPDTDDMDENITYSVATIKDATKKLASGYRVILSLYLFEGYDMEEISTILDIKPASVRSQYLRAKKKLLEIISKN